MVHHSPQDLVHIKHTLLQDLILDRHHINLVIGPIRLPHMAYRQHHLFLLDSLTTLAHQLKDHGIDCQHKT
jgi:hypothetical protein